MTHTNCGVVKAAVKQIQQDLGNAYVVEALADEKSIKFDIS